jgi:hypothetical protein
LQNPSGQATLESITRMERLEKLEALGIAMLNVIRDTRYDEELRAVLRGAYDSLEENVCRLQMEVFPPKPAEPRQSG